MDRSTSGLSSSRLQARERPGTSDVVRFLFVEDVPAFVELETRMLRRGGIDFEWRRVETLPAFRDAVREFRPHAILSDYLLPDADGASVLAEARELCPSVPFIFVSGMIGEDTAAELLERGATDYVRKERLNSLLPRVNRALREAGEHEARTELEARFRQREAFFHGLAEASSNGILLVNGQGRIVMVNGATEQMFGYAHHELDDAPLETLVPARFRRQHASHVARFMSNPADRDMNAGIEVPAMKKGGEEFQAGVTLSPIPDERGLHVLVTVRDLTASNRLRADIEAARHQLNTIPESLLLLDNEGRISYANEAWRRSARQDGAPPEVVTGVGLKYLDVCHTGGDPDASRIRENLAALLAGDLATFSAVYPNHSPQELRWFRLEARRVENGRGAVMLSHMDHTEAHLATARSRMQQRIAKMLADGPSMQDICTELVRSVCSEFEWSLGAVWLPGDDGKTLHRVSTRIAPEVPEGAFDAVTRTQRFTPGHGLPGRIWLSLKPEWNGETGSPSEPALSPAAAASGLKSGFGFPLQVKGELLAVLEFFSFARRSRDEALLSVLATAGAQAGDMIRRQRAETAQQLLLAEVQTVRTRLETLLRATPAFIAAVDRQGLVEFINRPFHHKSASMVGLPWVNLYEGEQRSIAQRALDTVLETGAPQSFELVLTVPNAQTMCLLNHIAPIVHGSRIVGAAMVAQDISERKRMEGELAIAQRLAAVGGLAAGVAHEINTPIQFVGDSLHFVREAMSDMFRLIEQLQAVRRSVEEGVPSAEAIAAASQTEADIDLSYIRENVPKAFERCLDGIERVATIVRAMKEFAHPAQMEMAAVDLNRAIQSTLVVARNEYKYVANLETAFGDLPLVTCRVNDINQVVLNLVVNAAHAIEHVMKRTEQRGSITVRTRVEGDMAVISVRDTGDGISDDVRHRIFEPFFTTKGVGRGTGQGLAIAWSIVVEKHGGELTFETERGVGTTFYIRLPIQGGSAEAAAMNPIDGAEQAPALSGD